MATPLADLHEALRTILADELAEGTADYQNNQLDAALRTVIRTGLAPDSVALAAGATPAEMDPGPPNNDTFGYLVIQAAILLIGGDTPFSLRTRAMSVTTTERGRRGTLRHLQALRDHLEEKGALHTDTNTSHVCSAAEDPLTSVSTLLRENLVGNQ